MSKVALVYASVHHQNTKKVADYIGAHFHGDIDIIDITKDKDHDLSEAEWVIFASGIYYGKLHEAITKCIDNADLTGKKVIVLYTCGMRYRNYAKAAGIRLNSRNAKYVGRCCCRGFDTFGPLQKTGGIAKKHPNEKDCIKVLAALEKLMQEH